MTHAVFGLAAPFLVLGDARGLFEKHPQLVGLGLDQPGDGALLDNGVTPRPQAGTEKDVGDVLAPAARTVEDIDRLPVAGHLALDGDFSVAGVLAAQSALTVVEHQFHRGMPHRLASGGAVEDHVGHGIAAQIFGRTFPHHPTHRVDDIGLTATVGADDADQATGQGNGGGIDEGFKS